MQQSNIVIKITPVSGTHCIFSLFLVADLLWSAFGAFMHLHGLVDLMVERYILLYKIMTIYTVSKCVSLNNKTKLLYSTMYAYDAAQSADQKSR